MSDSVAEHVLSHNERQNEQLTISAHMSNKYINLYERYIDEMEKNGALNRHLVHLPDSRVLQRRAGEQIGLTRPELSVLMSHTKIYLKNELLKSKILDDVYMLAYLFDNFPEILKEKYAAELFSHRLKKEIIITEFVHAMVSDMGITFVYQLQDELGASIEIIAVAYEAAKNIFNMPAILQEITELGSRIKSEDRVAMTVMVVSLVRRASRWIVREYPTLNISDLTNHFSDGTAQLSKRLPKLLLGASNEKMLEVRDKVLEMGAPEQLAEKISSTISIYHSLNIIDASKSEEVELFRVAKIYFILSDRLELQWVREQIDLASSSSRGQF